MAQITIQPTVGQGGVEGGSGQGAEALGAPYQPPEALAAPAREAPGGQESALGAAYVPPTDAPKAPHREIPSTEAASRGVINSLTFGFAPDIAGLAEASGMPSTAKNDDEIDVNPARPIVGAAKLLHQWLSEHPDPAVVEAYNKGRESYRDEDKASSDQHFAPFLAGQLVGALATPIAGGAGGVTTLGRVGRSLYAGAAGGGLTSAGEASSEGKGAGEVATEAAKGALTGAAFGTVGGTAAEAIGAGVGRVASIARGRQGSDAEASRRVAANLKADYKQTAPITATEQKVAQEAGVPRSIVDVGGDSTRSLARIAADTSPAAEQKLREMSDQRFWDQGNRISQWLRSKIGGADTEGTIAALQGAARKANSPKYRRAHAVADAKYPEGVWSPELERLMGSDALPKAIQSASTRGRDRAVAEGMGAFNPKVTYNNGILRMDKGAGVMAYPDLRFWDLVHRELSDAVGKAYREGEKGHGGALNDLHKQLLSELDKLVPEFGAARSTAAKFFGATEATEAGAKFVTENVNLQAAAREIAKMSAPERELFRIGFISEMSDKIARTRDKVNVINQAFVDSPAARGKISLALGSQGAREFEALLRVEAQVDKLRTRLGGSMTSRNMQHLAHAGGAAGAVGMFEMAKEGDFDPKHLLFGAVLIAGGRAAAHRVDARTAERVADMLLSKDPAILKQGALIVARDPKLFNALRATSNAAARVGEADVGPDRAMAGAAAGAMNILRGSERHEGHHSDNFDPVAGQVGPNQ